MGRIVLTGSSGLVANAVIDYILNETRHDAVLIDAKQPKTLIEDSRLQYVTADLTDPEVRKQAPFNIQGRKQTIDSGMVGAVKRSNCSHSSRCDRSAVAHKCTSYA